MTQGTPATVLPLLGETAPSFTAASTNGTIHFPKDYVDGWKIIFCHPADFTPVCSSELLDLSALQDDFTKMHVDIIVVSTDNLEKHKQWVKSLESLNYKNRPSIKINFPLVADEDHSIAKKYGMIHPGNNTTKDVRGVFIIDPQDKIRAMFYYPMKIGRNMEEIKRTVLALETADNNEVLTPAGWQQGDDVLLPYTKYTSDQQDLVKKEDPNVYMVSWYMWLKKMH
jgi:peroxiredoxin (alkyl hydroperoxide reductase subunit C)